MSLAIVSVYLSRSGGSQKILIRLHSTVACSGEIVLPGVYLSLRSLRQGCVNAPRQNNNMSRSRFALFFDSCATTLPLIRSSAVSHFRSAISPVMIALLATIGTIHSVIHCGISQVAPFEIRPLVSSPWPLFLEDSSTLVANSSGDSQRKRETTIKSVKKSFVENSLEQYKV